MDKMFLIFKVLSMSKSSHPPWIKCDTLSVNRLDSGWEITRSCLWCSDVLRTTSTDNVGLVTPQETIITTPGYVMFKPSKFGCYVLIACARLNLLCKHFIS